MSVIEAAIDYGQRDWSVIPTVGKATFVDEWQNSRIKDEPDILANFTSSHNVGVLLGEPSGWLVDVDLDHELAVELGPDYLPPTWAIFGRPGKPKSHFLYVAEGAVTHKRKPPDTPMLVELRSTGCQTVFPGSTHDKTGEPIDWVLNGPPAVEDATYLQACVDELADEVERRLGIGKSEHGRVDGNRGNEYPGLEDMENTKPALGFCSADVVSRAKRYVDKMPGAIAGQGGHQTTWKVAQALTRGFALDTDTALGLLADYNQRCEPPWSDKALAHKIQDASQKSKLRIGYLVKKPPTTSCS